MRVAYLIPTNRVPQAEAVGNLQESLIAMRAWICEQMDRNGVGKLAPRYEFEVDGVTPVIYTVNLATETDSDLRGDGSGIFGSVRTAAIDNGVPIDTPGEIWLLIPEIHQMNPDRSIDGGAAQGIGNGSGDDPGTAVFSTSLLSVMNLAGLRDDTPYDGLIIPGVGPDPLVYSEDPAGVRSLGDFGGMTISSAVSDGIGAMYHELIHSFGLVHDFRNDINWNGNIMANGFRGVRGALFPDLWPDDHVHLAHSAAQALSVSHYFSSCELISARFDAGGGQQAASASMMVTSETFEPPPACGQGVVCGDESDLTYDDYLDATTVDYPLESMMMSASMSESSGEGEAPIVTIDLSGALIPVDGKIEIGFTASDPDGLFLARLSRSVTNTFPATYAEMNISGTNVTATFVTSAYTQEVEEPFIVTVYDVKGYRTVVVDSVRPQGGENQGPTSNLRVTPPQAVPGTSLVYQAFNISDTGPLAPQAYEWQFDEGEPFLSLGPQDNTAGSYPGIGKPLVRLRVSDADGVSSVSAPIAVRIGEECGDGIDNDGDGRIDYPADPGCASVRSTSESPECDDEIDNDGDIDIDWDGGFEGVFEDQDTQCTYSWRNSEELLNASPAVSIFAPIHGTGVTTGDLVTFGGSAIDAEDGVLTVDLVWDSDRDGEIGTGQTFDTDLLSDGLHLITASVSDSGGEDGADAIQITVGPPAICDSDGLCEAGENCSTCPSDCVSGAGFCCGENACELGEDACNCSLDCGLPAVSEQPSLTCDDTLDNDCDSLVDCDDPDCSGAQECQPLCNNDFVCEPTLGENCNTCPLDCAGQTSGAPENRYCCGDDVDCNDSRCTNGGFICLLDWDEDGVSDLYDNCWRRANGTETGHAPDPRENGLTYQCDDDLDGFGNLCDCDFDQNGFCDQADADLLAEHFADPVDSSTSIFDMNCDGGVIGFADFTAYGDVSRGSGQMGTGGRQSGLTCAVTIPPLANDCPSPSPVP